MSQPVIRVENLSKEYQLGTVSHGTLTHDLQSWWAKLRGKEDPNSLLSHSPPRSPQSATCNPHFLALNNISFDVKQGDALGIIGRNGAGKSTLLKILSQVTSPSAGTVKIKGRVASLLEVGTGFHPELTGRENVFLNGAILGMTKAEIQSKFDEIVAFAEIEKFIDTPVKRYSSGMYVRLAFAVAAHLEPEILIIDEVLAVGDAQFQKKCLGKMQAVGNEGRTVLFVSHNMSVVSTLCDKGILLENGRVVVNGAITDAVSSYVSQMVESNSAKYIGKEFSPGEPHITTAMVQDSAGKPVQTVSSGAKVQFSFGIGNTRKGLTLNFSIYNMGGFKLVNFNTINLSAFDRTANNDEFLCLIDELLLSEGTYRVAVALVDGGVIIQHIDTALIFDVCCTTVRGRQIVNANFGTNVIMHHQWYVPN